VNDQLAAAQGATNKWLGLRYSTAQAAFQWVDSQPLGAYEPWAPAEPGSNLTNNSCVFVNQLSIWHVAQCDGGGVLTVKSWACGP
jgi:hypothetical protein